MMSKVIFVVLASLALSNAATISIDHNTNIAPIEREGRLIEIPIIGSVVFKAIKIACFLISTAWSLIGYKLVALALIAKAVFWVFHKCFSVVLGAAAVLGFCKLTGKCSLDFFPRQFVEVGESLVYAARNLEDGAMKYGNDLSY